MIEVRFGTYDNVFHRGYINRGYTFLFDGKPIAEMHNNLFLDNEFELIVFDVCDRENYVCFKTEDGDTAFEPTHYVLDCACKYLAKKIYKETMRNLDLLDVGRKSVWHKGETLKGIKNRFLDED